MATSTSITSMPSVSLVPSAATMAPTIVDSASTSMAPSISTASANPLADLPPTCQPTNLPRITTNLTGQVCQFTFPANLLSIQPCCNRNSWVQVQDNCTQYCNVGGTHGHFRHCVMALIGKQLEPEQRPEHWRVKCQTMPGEGKAKAAANKTQSSEGGDDESSASTAQTSIGVMGILVISLVFVGLIGL